MKPRDLVNIRAAYKTNRGLELAFFSWLNRFQVWFGSINLNRGAVPVSVPVVIDTWKCLLKCLTMALTTDIV